MYPMTFGKPPLPGNSQHTYICDSTKGLSETISAGASAAAPGTLRRMWQGARLFGTVTPTGQAVTVYFEVLKDPDGTTSSAWTQDTNGPDGGSRSVAAGTSWPWNWLPPAADWRIRVEAGATAPSDIDSDATMVFDRTSGL